MVVDEMTEEEAIQFVAEEIRKSLAHAVGKPVDLDELETVVFDTLESLTVRMVISVA